MIHARRLSLLLSILLALPAIAPAQTPAPDPQRHEFVIHNFKTESGAILPEAHIVYGTYGTLNSAHDNAVLLPSHYMANLSGYGFLIKSAALPDGALDTSKLFLITSELFGNGRSSSPSNTPEPFHGPRFPVMTIRDNVNAVHQLLTEELHIQHLKAVIGFSMGAQQAFQWAVSYPRYMDRIVATSGTAKTYGHGIVRLDAQITAITNDPAFMGGDYTAEPAKGLETFGIVWAGWLYSQEWWRKELWRTISPPGTTFDQFVDQHFHKGFIRGADANNLILQCRTWDSNNVGNTPGFNGDVEKALRSIKASVLYMPSSTDLYFPLEDAQYEAPFISRLTFKPIPSLWGHPAGAGASPEDKKFLNRQIANFFNTETMVTLKISGPAEVSKGGKILIRPELTNLSDEAFSYKTGGDYLIEVLDAAGRPQSSRGCCDGSHGFGTIPPGGKANDWQLDLTGSFADLAPGVYRLRFTRYQNDDDDRSPRIVSNDLTILVKPTPPLMPKE